LFGKRVPGVARKEDRRVERTERLLRDALFSLIQEKGRDALSVPERDQRALSAARDFGNESGAALNGHTAGAAIHAARWFG
jgi:hypothetical protein